MIAGCAVATPLCAQRVEVQLDGGVGRLSPELSLPSAFGYVSSALRVSGERLSWLLQGSVAQEAELDPAMYLATGLTFAPISVIGWSTDVSGGIGGSLGSSATSRFVSARQRVRLLGATWFAGYATGDTRRSVTTSANSAIEAGLSVAGGPQLFTIEARHYRTADWPLLENAGYYLTRAAKAYDLGELAASVRLRPGPLELLLWAGHRFGIQATHGSSVSYGMSAQVPLSPEGALTIAAGRQFADPMRGTPEGVIVTAGYRWQWASGGLHTPRRPATAPALEAMLERDASGRTVLVLDVTAPAGTRVEFGASFREWTPVDVPLTGTRYILRVPLPPGMHRVAVRVNGGAWQSPAGLPRVDDELGGEAGLVIVSPAATP